MYCLFWFLFKSPTCNLHFTGKNSGVTNSSTDFTKWPPLFRSENKWSMDDPQAKRFFSSFLLFVSKCNVYIRIFVETMMFICYIWFVTSPEYRCNCCQIISLVKRDLILNEAYGQRYYWTPFHMWLQTTDEMSVFLF